MVYVPTSPPGEPVSPRVRELSKQLEQVADDFRRRYAMSDSEIRQALLHAAGRSGGSGARRPVVALAAGAVAALIGLGVFVAGRAGEGAALPLVEIAIGALVIGFVLVRLRNR